MDTIELIKKKIKENDRNNIVFIHPIIPNEEIAKYISAFSNSNGGIIVFGVKDDGNKVWLRRSVFNILKQQKKIRELIHSPVNLTFGEFYEEGNKIEYIHVEKIDEMVYVSGEAYKVNSGTNRIEEILERKLFLSYCQKDSCIADIIEEKVAPQIKNIRISRDIRDVEYKESFSDFMHSIGEHDFVVTIISDSYLKSRNCMYEIVEIMRDRNFINKLLYLILFEDDIKFYDAFIGNQIKADIYSIEGQTTYIKYWQSVEKNLRKMILELEDPLVTVNHTEELIVVTKIKMEMQEFMRILRDRNGISFGEMLDSNFKEIVSNINKQ
ncbi:putative DNA binding domain-containing protein [Lysinibacillus fusiformis]|uniref:RNA-binding domain-containing protein n=1 Tax=Lysinibacillus fusiformis TaxID=28031 RepID=UPI001E42419F|nr:RNA-binding domain-containing protein [Lysinibacillus fusiformis]MCE4045580.1 putative DNA binding domain-containing protein [Lysinibacillus fusiformis]